MSDFSIAPAPGGGTGDALRLSLFPEQYGIVLMPNTLTRPVTRDSGETIAVSLDIYVAPGRGGATIHLGKG